jgi:hypothetical protein
MIPCSCLGRVTVIASIWMATALTNHATERTTSVAVVRIPSRGQPLKAQLGPDGTIHVLLDSIDGPLYLKSQDDGLTFSEPIAVVEAAAQKPGLKFEGADLAVSRDGRVHMAMSNNAWKLKLPQEEWGLYSASLAPGARAFSPVRNLNRKPSEAFALAADGGAMVTATFLSDKLFAMVSRDDGQTFTASAELNQSWDPCNCCTTSAAYGADGKLALLYREETNNERDMFVVLWDQHGDGKPLRRRVSVTPWKIAGCPMTYFAISRAGMGYVAAWPTKGQVYFARLDKEGRVLPPGEIRTPGTSGMRKSLLALSAPEGSTLIGWKNKDVLGWQLYDANGQTKGNPASTESLGSGAAGVQLRDGRFLLFP